jgi:hypothetical protein
MVKKNSCTNKKGKVLIRSSKFLTITIIKFVLFIFTSFKQSVLILEDENHICSSLIIQYIQKYKTKKLIVVDNMYA